MKRTIKEKLILAKDPYRVFLFFKHRHLLDWLPDKAYLKLAFRMGMGYPLDLDAPKTFNEKLQWLKLYDRDPLYTAIVDKYTVRQWVAERIGEKYLIPLVGGPWQRAEDIDFDSLPDQFVLKCNHNSGSVIVCRDKSSFDMDGARKKLQEHLGRNYYYSSREWPYKDIRPCIIAERFMKDDKFENLSVYKILCFGGEPKIIQTIKNDKTKDESIDYFDTDWQLLDMRQNFPNSKEPLEKPEGLPQMLELARKLSAGFPQIRTDLYYIGGQPYFSELTLFSDSGLAAFDPPEWDYTIGSWLELPGKR